MPRRPFTALIAGQPYRLLFPTGTLLAIHGALLWPLHAWGFLPTYPGVAHARIMTQGFLACFVFGFLGTAAPRLIGAPGLTLIEVASIAALLVAAAGLHTTGHSLWGDQIFLLALLFLIAAFGLRIIIRRDVPPPSFAIAALGLLSALVGDALFIFGPLADLPPWHDALARLLVYQGFLLLPVLGVGAFLLPRFFDLPNRQDFPESIAPPKGWTLATAWSLACGMAVLLSFVWEALGHKRSANLGRALVVGTFLLWQLPPFRAKATGTISRCVATALLFLTCAYPTAALAPPPAVAWAHLLFIGGFGMLTFAVATRVILGHSGAGHLFRKPIRSLLAFAILAVLALATRVSADFLPTIRLSHLAYAAIAWIAGVVTWSAAVLPRVATPDPED
ncbi:MAG TPA: NnrS family protein [Verrucomicrobiae bacterium]|nr:NnrS family protein [Verrucomicrobiae bacterium]